MLPTVIRPRLTLTIMCALLMTMSLLLTVPLHTAFAQSRTFWYAQSTILKNAMAGEDIVAAGVRPATGSPTLTNSGTFTVIPRIRLRWIGGTAGQHYLVLNAWANGSLRALNASRRPADKRFISWFGAYNPNRFAYVMNNYYSFYNSMEEDQYTIDFTGTGCTGDIVAYTSPGGRTIWLCNLYWILPFSGLDSKIGALLHEVTHAVAMTQDYVYGPANCQTLAAYDPNKAIHNASNYEYFAMI